MRSWLLGVIIMIVMILGVACLGRSASSASPTPRCDRQHPHECSRLASENRELRRAVAWQRTARIEREVAFFKTSVERSFQLARIVYGDSWAVKLVHRIQSCESTGGRGIDPNAKNGTSTAAHSAPIRSIKACLIVFTCASSKGL